MIRTRTLTIIFVACFVASLLAIAFLLASRSMIFAYQRSFMKRRVANVTAIACAIERYRARHGQLPSAAELQRAEPQMAGVFGDPHVTVALAPPHYVVQEVEPGLDDATKWCVVDGRWQAYARNTPKEYLHRSEASIAECGRNVDRPPN